MYTQEALFERLCKLEADKLVLTQDIAQLKKDFKFNKKKNPSGLDKEIVRTVAESAKLHAKRNYEETREGADAVFSKYEELTKYHD